MNPNATSQWGSWRCHRAAFASSCCCILVIFRWVLIVHLASILHFSLSPDVGRDGLCLWDVCSKIVDAQRYSITTELSEFKIFYFQGVILIELKSEAQGASGCVSFASVCLKQGVGKHTWWEPIILVLWKHQLFSQPPTPLNKKLPKWKPPYPDHQLPVLSSGVGLCNLAVW